MSYAVPAALFHRTEVAPEFLHATLFYFDSSRGFVQTAPVLGPKDAESSTQLRDAAGIDAMTLAGKVESVQAWERVLGRARRLAGSGQWALALEAFSAALAMCCPHGSGATAKTSPASSTRPTPFSTRMRSSTSFDFEASMWMCLGRR
ncbi:hypothetical protein B0A55_09780, partial [Friedmanniomyces simplex]